MQEPIVLNSCPIWLPRTQTWLYGQVSELQRIGIPTHIVCRRTENLDQFNVENIHCLSLESPWKRWWENGLRLLRIRRYLSFLVTVARQKEAQILHSHFGNVGWGNLGAVRRLRVKHVVTFYGLDVNRLPTQSPRWRARYRRLFDEVDRVLCEGSHMADCIVQLGCPLSKLRVQHIGVDVNRIEFKPRQWSPGEPLRVLIAASFREKKGIPYAIAAIGRLRGLIPVEITVIGDAGNEWDSRKEKSRILRTIHDQGLGPYTRLLGYQPHETLFGEAYRHHIFLQPSVTASDGDTEGGAPVGIIEMLASGMLVVTTQHCDIPEVLGPQLKDLMAPERDVEGLFNCLRTLIEHPQAWAKLADCGRARIALEYNRVRQAQRLAHCYREVAGNQ
jgi:colanic acid/amylovoran biosynthesis glycosyltransferase